MVILISIYRLKLYYIMSDLQFRPHPPNAPIQQYRSINTFTPLPHTTFEFGSYNMYDVTPELKTNDIISINSSTIRQTLIKIQQLSDDSIERSSHDMKIALSKINSLTIELQNEL